VTAQIHRLPGAETLDLSEGQVLAEDAGKLDAFDDFATTLIDQIREVERIRAARKLALMPADQDAIARGNDVGLDEAGAHANSQLVRSQRVLGTVATGAAMADDHGTLKRKLVRRRAHVRSRSVRQRRAHRKSVSKSGTRTALRARRSYTTFSGLACEPLRAAIHSAVIQGAVVQSAVNVAQA